MRPQLEMQWRRTFGVFDDARDLALHDGDGRVGGTQIDTNDGTLHLLLSTVCVSSRKERRSEGRGLHAAKASGRPRHDLDEVSQKVLMSDARILTLRDILEENMM